MSKCYECPRQCGADRSAGKSGFCRVSEDFSVAKIMIHRFEEPCICADGGAGAIFFSGCNLGCVFCQNRDISGAAVGKNMTSAQLEREIFSLVESGADCIEFITPSHYTASIAHLLERIKPRITVPVVWNSNAYEKVDSLRVLDGLVDVYLPDFKYFSPELASKYSSAPDYPSVALAAVKEMVRQTGAPVFFGDISVLNGSGSAGEGKKMIKRGVIVRHLVLPSHRADSIAALELLAREIGAENVLLSLMSQYTPDFYIERELEMGACDELKNLRRRVTSFEYDSVAKVADFLGFDGYFQARESASSSYTPDF